MKNKIILKIAQFLRIIRGEVSTEKLIEMGLNIGIGFSRQGGVRIDHSCCHLISIGDYVTLAPNVTILAHDASLQHFLGVTKIGKVIIGNKVFIGASSIILPNVEIGDNVIIGAGSVVTKDIPSNTVYAGNPARFLCTIDDIINKNAELIHNSPVFDSSYSTLNLNDEKRKIMKQKLDSGMGYQECWNRKNFIKL